MKISKNKLKQIILEEFETLAEDPTQLQLPFGTQDRRPAGDDRRDALPDAAAKAAQGITPQERGAIKKLNDMLVAGATNKNILTGDVIQKIKALAVALQKALQDVQAQQGAE